MTTDVPRTSFLLFTSALLPCGSGAIFTLCCGARGTLRRTYLLCWSRFDAKCILARVGRQAVQQSNSHASACCWRDQRRYDSQDACMADRYLLTTDIYASRRIRCAFERPEWPKLSKIELTDVPTDTPTALRVAGSALCRAVSCAAPPPACMKQQPAALHARTCVHWYNGRRDCKHRTWCDCKSVAAHVG